MSVAQTILSQLGGNKFIVMTGAKNFVNGGNYLLMTLPKNKSGATRLKITLNEADLYELEFFNIKKFEIVVKNNISNVYVDQLLKSFENETGMLTKL